MLENKQLLLQYGWIFKGSCRCSGFQTLKFSLRTEAGEIYLRLRHHHFMISRPVNNSYKKYTKFPIEELPITLDEIFSTYKIIVLSEAKVSGISK